MADPMFIALPILVTKFAPVANGVTPETAEDFLVGDLREVRCSSPQSAQVRKVVPSVITSLQGWNLRGRRTPNLARGTYLERVEDTRGPVVLQKLCALGKSDILEVIGGLTSGVPTVLA